MGMAMTSSPQPPPPPRRRRSRLQSATTISAPNANPNPNPKAKVIPILSDVGRFQSTPAPNGRPNSTHKGGKALPLLLDVGSNPSAIDYYSRVASNLAGAGRLGDFLIAAEGLRAAAGDSGFAARINWRLLSRGVDAALRDHGLPHVLEFLRDADRIGVQAAVMLDPDASDAVAAACRQLMDERIMVEFVEAIEALASCGFFVKNIVDPMDVLKIFVRKRDPDMAIRYARIFPHSQLLLCNTMEAFGKRKELKHALKVFRALKDQLGGINMFACRSIIDICSHCGSSVQARIIFEGLLAEKITPNTHVFNSLMNANAHSLSYNFSVYKHMQKLGVPPDLASYNILLKTCCNAREFNLAQEIYEEIKKKEHGGALKLDVFTYSTMIKVFAEAKMWKKASNIKDDMRAVGVRLNLVTWSSLINAYANSGLVDGAIEILEEMIRDGCQPTAPCFNIILTSLVKSCQYDRAFRLFNSWRESGIKVSLSVEQKKCLPDNFTFCEEHLSKNGGTILVVPFRPTVTTYNILMMACGTNDERAKSVMNEMRRSGLCPDRISWSILIDIYGTSQNRNGAIQALRRMQRVGIKLNVSAYTVAIKACVESKDMKMAFHLFEEMKAQQLKPNMVTYRTLLTARCKYGSLQEIQQCLAIYQEMRRAGYQAYDYYLKELIVEWSEGVLSSGSGKRDFYHLDLKDERNKSFNIFLEKVARFLQKDVDQNQTVDVRGLSKVEARIVVLSTLRKIKEKYLLGTSVQDDLVIITGHEKTSYTDIEATAIDVEHAITSVLTDELGLEVFIGPQSHPPLSSKVRAPQRPRRPQGMIKITVNSLNHWLKKKAVRDV
ncbi:pentatricopeptide repeat-containing protein At5g02830, chloroplastic-like [Lolium rigidum]|uniref:pentatricopeptide repeat-containing protein At5g02830, chloroplastic-like n=1 Tax=Lolium rigidum TaxID=89674 RepID=UPI001F5C9265|nr:pentatricopeptide repeat-containing protein At5g02830, chloroplastic-like [Lolium rigidum]